MKKQLFFDDNKLFAIDNVVRKNGKPKLIGTYIDAVCSMDFCTGQVFRLDNGKYRMLYFGHSSEYEGKKLFAAISDDGIKFEPEKLFPEKKYSHEIMTLPPESEVAFIYEDKRCDNSNERYKLLMAELTRETLDMVDKLYVSANLLEWTLKENVCWGDGCEPLASVFYNSKKGTHTIIERPFWGVRCAGYKETTDWKSFSTYKKCLNVDSNDERLSEIYGMYAFEYDGMYIGLPHMYRNLQSELCAKFKNGIIDTQLAYSYDGEYWQRGLHEPFLSGLELEKVHKMMWAFCSMRCDDGSINFYASASEFEHGEAFSNPGTGKIFVFNMREDGFISLSTVDMEKTACVATREKIWHGGEVQYNLKAKEATVAVYITDESEMLTGNIGGVARPLEGYGHEDCIPFNGDCTNWVPQYKSGKKVDELKGKTLVFEIKFTDGELFSLSGDFTDVYNTQAARYRKFGSLPK